jgi:solute carrier family 32 (vesicular inhibitory amino acid transporter)
MTEKENKALLQRVAEEDHYGDEDYDGIDIFHQKYGSLENHICQDDDDGNDENEKERESEIEIEMDECEQHGGGGTSNAMHATFNVASSVMGPAMLSLPYALSVGGWLTLVLIVFLAVVCYVTGRMLRRCLETMVSTSSTGNDVGRAQYACVAEAAGGRWAKMALLTAQFGELFCTAVSFLIILGTSMEQMFPTMTWGGYAVSSSTWSILSAALLAPTLWVRSMRWMAWLSAVSLLSAGLAVATVVYVGVADELLLKEPLAPADLLFNGAGMGVAAGIILFAFGGHGLYPIVYRSVKTTRQFNVALNCSTLIFVGVYILLAVCGYRAYGEATNQVITLNVAGVPGRIATFMVLAIALLKYALQLHPIVDRIEAAWQLRAPSVHRCIAVSRQCAVRLSLVLATLAVAVLFPFFALVNSFIGAVFSSAVSIIFPALFYALLHRRTLTTYQYASAIAIVIVGVIMLVIGTLASTYGLIESLSN